MAFWLSTPLRSTLAAFDALHSAPLQLTVPSNNDPLHIFVDGSCFWPQNRLFSVSAAAAVVADTSCNGEGVMHSLVLPGCEQSNDRAEVCAILLALQLTPGCTFIQTASILPVDCPCQNGVSSYQTHATCHDSHRSLGKIGYSTC